LPEVTSRLSEYLLKAGDIVFGRKGAVDRSAWVKPEESGWFLGSDGIRARLPVNVDSRFIAYQLRSEPIREWLLRHASGSTLLSLNQSTLSRVPLVLPSVSEQRAIAEVLGALDDKIAANTKLVVSVDEYLAAKFSEALQCDHEIVELGDIAVVNATKVKPLSGASLRYLDIAGLGIGSHDWPELSPWDTAPSRARRGISVGDTIWSTVRPNRRSHALVLSEDSSLVGSTGLAVLTPKEVGFAYLYEVTKRDDFTSYLENVAEGSAYPAVRASFFAKATIPLIDASDRASFEQLAAPMRNQQHLLSMENTTLAATRDSLLPQLMSGKLRVKDAEKTLEAVI
jgi:type I restriction enzyme S subunit